MAKYSVLALALIALIAAPSFAQTITLNQNVDCTTITAGNSVSCNAAGVHADNSYYRTFSLTNQGVFSDIVIYSVTFGIEVATAGLGAQPVRIVLFEDTAPAAGVIPDAGIFATPTQGNPPDNPKAGTLTCLLDETFSVPNGNDGTLFTYNFCAPITVPIVTGTEQIVAAIATPDGAGSGGGSFFIGSNPNGETGTSFLSSAACGIVTPTATAGIGFPTMHILLKLDAVPVGTPVPGGNPFSVGTCGDLSIAVTVNGAPSQGPAHAVVMGDTVGLTAISAGGGALGSPILFLFGTYATGAYGGPLALPAPFTGTIVGGATTAYPPPIPGIGAVLLGPGGFNVTFAFPFPAGTSIIAQALATYASPSNGFYDTSGGISCP